jgi:hypothetical protein
LNGWEEGLGQKCSARVDLSELGSDFVADCLDYFVLIQEVDLPFGGMDVDIEPVRLDFDVEIDKWMATFG